jgi:tRNA(Ile)-lysidine synthase TilS/MesJ
MFRCSKRLASTVKAISVAEFKSAISPWLPKLSQGAGTIRISKTIQMKADERCIALAVSGGVDSMALAFLCKQALPPAVSDKLVAFVVDHKLREKSGDEAQKVKGVLEKKLGMLPRGIVRWGYVLTIAIGITTQILEAPRLLQLLNHDRSNLESEARKARYGALGQACLDQDVTVLLSGHNQDDRIENVILRLSRQHKFRLDMTGGFSNIPCCDGMYGLDQSGKPDDFDTQTGTSIGVRGFENGGVKVFRPLLGFDKSQLLATCVQNNVPWLEDASNFDRALTERNTIRGLIQDKVLPRAFSKESILKSIAAKTSEMEKVDEMVDVLFNACDIQFNPLAGILYVRLPGYDSIESLAGSTGLGPHVHQVATTHLVQRLARIVSPHKICALNSMADVWGQLYPCHGLEGGKPEPKRFQAGGVSFTPMLIDSELPLPIAEKSFQSVELDTKRYWILSSGKHDGFALHQAEWLSSKPISERTRLHFAVDPSSREESEIQRASSNFKLYDNRFWISVHNGSPETVWLRPLANSHLASLREQFKQNRLDIYSSSPRKRNESLRRLGLSRHRLTKLDKDLTAKQLLAQNLPVIEWIPKEAIVQSSTKTPPIGQVLALPTLGIRFQGIDNPEFPNWASKIEWIVRYRKVDLGSHDLSRCLIFPNN